MSAPSAVTASLLCQKEQGRRLMGHRDNPAQFALPSRMSKQRFASREAPEVRMASEAVWNEMKPSRSMFAVALLISACGAVATQ